LYVDELILAGVYGRDVIVTRELATADGCGLHHCERELAADERGRTRIRKTVSIRHVEWL